MENLLKNKKKHPRAMAVVQNVLNQKANTTQKNQFFMINNLASTPTHDSFTLKVQLCQMKMAPLVSKHY